MRNEPDKTGLQVLTNKPAERRHKRRLILYSVFMFTKPIIYPTFIPLLEKRRSICHDLVFVDVVLTFVQSWRLSWQQAQCEEVLR